MTKEEWLDEQAKYQRVQLVGTSEKKRKAAHQFRLATAERMKAETHYDERRGAGDGFVSR